MRVMKFGGGCLTGPDDLARAAELAGGAQTVVVVSALSGVTDELIRILERAAKFKRFPQALFRSLSRRHRDCMQALALPQAAADGLRSIDQLLHEAERLLRGITCIGEVPASIRSRFMGYGEELSCLLMCAALEARNVKAAACDARCCGISADRPGTDARIDLTKTRRKLRRHLQPLIKNGKVPVITGFFGRAPDGTTAIFGRNASDYSAAAVACALDAAELLIWKGVDGIMTMDPVYGRDARSVKRLTWEEVKELTHFGANILHPLTLEPLENSRTRVHIRNFRKPEQAGTEISSSAGGNRREICAITCHPGATMLQLSASPAKLHQLLTRLEEGRRMPVTRITSMATARDRVTLLMPAADARILRRALDSAGEATIRVLDTRNDRALVAVVGQVLAHPRGLARLMSALATAGITIEGITPGGAVSSLCLVIPGNQAGRCVRAIHKRFFPPGPHRHHPSPTEINHDTSN
ncbi:MAG: aspartate kinase [Acidobacteriota bacterium]|jgi:aspartate kinase|nr:aspartate kinase [Acidobacteriota bacterium]